MLFLEEIEQRIATCTCVILECFCIQKLLFHSFRNCFIVAFVVSCAWMTCVHMCASECVCVRAHEHVSVHVMLKCTC